MSRPDEVFGLLRVLRDQFGVLDDLVRGFRDREGSERRRRWESHRRAATAAVSRARRAQVRRGAEAAMLGSGAAVFLLEGAGWAWLAVPLFGLSVFRLSQVRAVAIPPAPATDDEGPVVLPDAPRGSRAGELLRRAAAAREAIDGMLPLLRAPASGLADVVTDTRGVAERTVADLGRGVLGLERMTRQPGAPAAAHASLGRLTSELERAVTAFEDLAATTAHSLTESGSTAANAEFQARLAGVRAVLRTVQTSSAGT